MNAFAHTPVTAWHASAEVRQKFYISTAHTDADVDRTLEAVGAAFKELAEAR